MIRYIGYACINNTLRGKGKSQVYTSRSVTLRTFNISKVSDIALQNCKDLLTILKWNKENNILFFRIGSGFFPFATHPVVGYQIEDLATYPDIVKTLGEAGNYARTHKMRLNTHPGPTTLIASPNPKVVNLALKDIELHAKIGNLLGQNLNYTINFHVGGPYGNKVETAKRYCNNFHKLSDNAKKMITVENDDRKSGYTVEDLYKYIYLIIGVPIVFDYHHWSLNSGKQSPEQALETALSTWNNKIPDIHWSSPRNGINDVAHADYVDKIIDYCPHRIYDCMLEAKMKELAVLRLR